MPRPSARRARRRGRPRLPAEQRRRALQHLDAARIGELRQAELDRGRAARPAASSSVKLSTAKQLAILPGARMLLGRSGASFSQCDRHLDIRHLIGRIAVLGDEPGRQARRLRDAGRLRAEQRHVGQARRRLGQPHLGAPGGDAAVGVERPGQRSSNCGGPLGSQPCSSARVHCTRTGWPTAFDRSAASAAASSWPFMP